MECRATSSMKIAEIITLRRPDVSLQGETLPIYDLLLKIHLFQLEPKPVNHGSVRIGKFCYLPPNFVFQEAYLQSLAIEKKLRKI